MIDSTAASPTSRLQQSWLLYALITRLLYIKFTMVYVALRCFLYLYFVPVIYPALQCIFTPGVTVAYTSFTCSYANFLRTLYMDCKPHFTPSCRFTCHLPAVYSNVYLAITLLYAALQQLYQYCTCKVSFTSQWESYMILTQGYRNIRLVTGNSLA